VRPASAATTLTVQYSSNGGRSWHGLAGVRTDARGAWAATGRFVPGRIWRVRWVTPGGRAYTGAPTRAYTPSGQLQS